MDINQMSSGTKAKTGGGGLLPGNYPGTVQTPVKKTTKDGAVYYSIPIKTDSGAMTFTSIFDFDDDDIRDCETNAKLRQNVQNKIGFAKGIYVTLGIWSDEEAATAGWSAGERSVLGCLAQLAGKRCIAAVVARKDKPEYTNTYINELKDDGNSAPTGAVDDVPPPAGQNFSGEVPSLDDVPF